MTVTPYPKVPRCTVDNNNSLRLTCDSHPRIPRYVGHGLRSRRSRLSGARGVERVSDHGGLIELGGRGHGPGRGTVLVVVMQCGVVVDYAIGRGYAADADATDADTATVPAGRRRLISRVLDGCGQSGRTGRRERHRTGAGGTELLLVMVHGRVCRWVHTTGRWRDQG